MRDTPDPNSPYFILRRADGDPVAGMSTAGIEGGSAEPGPPLKVEWKVAYYESPTLRPGDLYDGTDVKLAVMTAEIDPAPVVFASRALYERLEALAPGTMSTIPVLLTHEEDAPLDYLGLIPRASLAARKAADAKPTDLQWGPLAFSPEDAPAPLFTLALSDSIRLLVVKRSIGAALGVENLGDVQLSAFHRTSEEGGARAATAALQRVLRGEATPADREAVAAALEDGMNPVEGPSAPKTRTTGTPKGQSSSEE